jgi:hypothetical protein
MKADSIAVHPEGLATLVEQLTGLADRLMADGAALHELDRPLLGGSDPANELADIVTANMSSTAASVMACGGALRGLARVARVAEVSYRTTEQQVAARWSAMVQSFADINDRPVDRGSPIGSRPSG